MAECGGAGRPAERTIVGEQIMSKKGVLGVIGGESPANEHRRILWLVPVEEENKRGFVNKASLSCQIILGVSKVVSLLALDRLKMCVPDGTFPALIIMRVVCVA